MNSSLLELLHPDGRARRSLVIGNNCPALLRPAARAAAEDGEQAALIILSPTPGECRRRGWLGKSVARLADRLALDGIGYVLAPRRWRLAIALLLHKTGLSIDAAFGHFPNWALSHYLLPFTRTPVQYALSELIPAWPWKQVLARGWFGLPGAGKMLGFLWPSAGLAIRRPGARPVFQWLFQPGSENCDPGMALLRTRWRRAGPAVT